MTEAEARAWATARFDAVTIERLDRLAAIVTDASARQNLIAASTRNAIWSRHIVDSLQLIAFAQPGHWLDIGTGAGFPGLAVAAAEPGRTVTAVEPRRLRADYLRTAADVLGLDNVAVSAKKVEAVSRGAAVISARAVARIAALFEAAVQCATQNTVWLLPKGQNAGDEVVEAKRTWHGVFHVEQSITNPDSAIVIVRDVQRR